jgi:hypothetical protein
MEERRTMSKSGVAMPDGSYYIRDAGELDDAIAAVGRATPNAGESDVARRNSVRRHIMKRARALNLASKIPDTWNPDGSLKQSGIDDLMTEIDEFLAHFGVKGMHWGVRHSKAHLEAKAAEHEKTARAHVQAAAHVKRESDDLRKNGLQSAAFKRVFGQTAPSKSEWYFFRQHGVSRAEALQETDNNLRRLHNQYVRSANRHSAKAATLRSHAANMTHEDVDEFLEHFGVKGMRWGVRRRHPGSSSSSHPSGPITSEAARAARLGTRAKTHGTKSLTNAELQVLVTRLNLENQYGKLNPQQVNAGKTFVKDVGKNIVKQEASNLVSQYGRKGAAWVAGIAAAKVAGMIIKRGM